MKRRLLHPFIMILLAMVAMIQAAPDLQRARSQFQKGNDAYEKGQYQVAVEHYRNAVQSGPEDASLFYNYANALFREGKIGHAILYYEKALELKPYDPDIRYNLKFVNSQILDKVPEQDSNFFLKVMSRIAYAFPLNAGLWIAFSFWAALCFLFGLKFLIQAGKKVILWVMISVCVFGLVLTLPLISHRIIQLETQTHAIVLKEEVSINSGPGENFQTLAKVHSGTKFEILEDRGNWLKVMLPNGSGGFVKAQGLGRI